MNNGYILLAESEPDLRKRMANTFQDLGYAVQEALTGCEALYALGRNPRHCLFLVASDDLPEVNGVEIITSLNELKRLEDIQIPNIIITVAPGREHNEDIEEVRAAGVVPVIVKPYSPKEILDLFHETFGNLEN